MTVYTTIIYCSDYCYYYYIPLQNISYFKVKIVGFNNI